MSTGQGHFDHMLSAFLSESRDLLETMERELLTLERGEQSDDTINAIFRAAHTIKGSGGMFGLETIVTFTHRVETLLDRLRSGKQSLSPSLIALLLDCKDHIGSLIEVIEMGSQDFNPLEARQQSLLVALQSFLTDQGLNPQPPPSPLVVQAALDADANRLATQNVAVQRSISFQNNDANHVLSDSWHISVRFNTDILKFGLDPLTIIRYLSEFGELLAVRLVDDSLPPINQFDPESCYLGFEIRYCTNANKEQIESAFEFVCDDCTLRILPPRSKVQDYIELIKAMPEGDHRLGELLVQCGSLTPDELTRALAQQAEAATELLSPPPLGEILIEQKVVHAPVVEAALQQQRRTRDVSNEKRAFRIDADKLDHLIDRIGELIIAGAATQVVAQRICSIELTETLSVLSRLVEDVREQALKLRMVPLGNTFDRFQRLVRDVARDLGKDIRLEIRGGETELDKTLVEQIVDPLTHLVRNAIDHGIEPVEQRIERGKARQGLIQLNAHHESGAVVIEVSDDGGGLSRERIFKKAVTRGLISEQSLLNDREIHELIFEPGFSTAEQVTNLSGRGVGMDVVRRNVINLRGSIEIDSKEGLGTTMRIRLPLTLAIIEGFLVRVGRSIFVIPLNLVEECIELPSETSDPTQPHDFIDLRGHPLPYLRLREFIGVMGKSTRRESVVVLRGGGGRSYGLVVDELLGEMQTVIKPLARIFNHLKGIAGWTILGDGSVALILNVSGLLKEWPPKVAPKPASNSTKDRLRLEKL